MRIRPFACHVLLVALLACPSGSVPQPRIDKLAIRDIAGGDKVIVMLDARTRSGAAGCKNDEVLRSKGELQLPNLLASAGCNSEIAIFSENNAMLLDTSVKAWTDDAGDVHTVNLRPIIEVPVSVWIANAGTEARAKNDIARANVLYTSNKVGVKFVATFKDVSGNAGAVAAIDAGVAAPTADNISCTDALTALKTSPYFTAKRLNVYYVNGAFTGRNCAIKKTPHCDRLDSADPGDGNITYIGTTANRASLAHEFGHAFGLRPAPCGGHTENLAGFGPDNIMHGAGDGNRNKFTLGQIFRMNVQRDRWDGTMLIKNGLRPGPGRACPPLASDDKCPELKLDWPRP